MAPAIVAVQAMASIETSAPCKPPSPASEGVVDRDREWAFARDPADPQCVESSIAGSSHTASSSAAFNRKAQHLL